MKTSSFLTSISIIALSATLGACCCLTQTVSTEKLKLSSSFDIDFAHIKAGKFIIGSPRIERGRDKDEIQKELTIDSDFYMAKYELTQAQYSYIMDENPSHFQGKNRPVENVTWDSAMLFCEKLNALTEGMRPEGYVYTLPSEAQWEYACRAGSTTPFYFGDSLSDSQANFDGNYPYKAPKGKFLEQTVDVGSYPANAWGLYDMHGNVWEWTIGWYMQNYKGEPTVAVAEENIAHVARGGGWECYALNCRSAFRRVLPVEGKTSEIGFRLVLAPQEKTK